MNIRDLPGPGDAVTWGPITSPNDPRADDDSDDLEVVTETLFQNYMASPTWVSDAQGEFTGEEYDLIVAAVQANDATLVGELTITATHRVVRAWAEKEARRQLGIIECEAEAEYAADRAAA